jgi:hypothetical protein
MRKYLKWSAYPLTLGASLLLGLLSFSGMFALWPILGLAVASFALSVLYEGEIYKKNITQALDKLLDKNLILEKVGKEAIEQLLSLPEQPKNAFIKDYLQAKTSKKNKAHLKKMDIWLGKLLLTNNPETAYQTEVLDLFPNQNWKKRADTLNFRNQILKAFSALTAVVMTLGTTYLLLDTITVLPFLSIAPAMLPYIIIPLSFIAGIAYGFLTYNSLASFLLDHSLTEWWNNFKQQLIQKPTNLKQILFTVGAALIFTLNLTLTLCTAGTWWTVMNQSRALWGWLQHRGIQAIQWLTPLVMGIANLGFNTRNIVETIKAITPKTKTKTHEHHEHHEHHHHTPKETTEQKFNPFRFLLKLTYMPLRILLFIGHLISIGVTGDRMPGIPAIVSALLGIVSEGFEDAHYFFDLKALNEHHHHEEDEDDEEHGHEHSDLPNQILQLTFSPLFFLAALWHYGFQNTTSKPKTLKECFNLMCGKEPHEHEHEHCHEHTSSELSKSWYVEESMMIVHEQIERLKTCSHNPELIKDKLEILKSIETQCKQPETIKQDTLDGALQHPCIKTHRYRFFNAQEPTETARAVQEVAHLMAQYQRASVN